MKKVMLIVLSGILIFMITACNKQENNKNKDIPKSSWAKIENYDYISNNEYVIKEKIWPDGSGIYIEIKGKVFGGKVKTGDTISLIGESSTGDGKYVMVNSIVGEKDLTNPYAENISSDEFDISLSISKEYAKNETLILTSKNKELALSKVTDDNPSDGLKIKILKPTDTELNEIND